jgi:acyl-coenzyme A synthetase/AMP-(fatty) acid ligase
MGKVVDNMAEANIKWFVDAKVNITKTVLTDTLPKGDKTAIIFEPNDQAKKHYIFPILNTNAFVKWQMYCGTRIRKEKIVFVSIYR